MRRFATANPRGGTPGDLMVINCPASTHRQIRPSLFGLAPALQHGPGVAGTAGLDVAKQQQVATVVEWRSRGNPSEE